MPCRLLQVFRFFHSFLFDRHSDTHISISSQKTRLNKYHYLNKDYLSNGSVEERSDKERKKRKKKAKDGQYFSRESFLVFGMSYSGLSFQLILAPELINCLLI